MVFQDDLPSISVSRLRALGVVTTAMTQTTVSIADVEVEVGLELIRFRNGNSWSYFRCPFCGRLRGCLSFSMDACCAGAVVIGAARGIAFGVAP
jgi:hypothetical protein